MATAIVATTEATLATTEAMDAAMPGEQPETYRSRGEGVDSPSHEGVSCTSAHILYSTFGCL